MKQLYVALKGFVLASLLCLILTANASGSWVTTTVDPGNVRGPTSLALDSSDKAHVSYFDFADLNAFALKYATNASDCWSNDHCGLRWACMVVDLNRCGQLGQSTYQLLRL